MDPEQPVPRFREIGAVVQGAETQIQFFLIPPDNVGKKRQPDKSDHLVRNAHEAGDDDRPADLRHLLKLQIVILCGTGRILSWTDAFSNAALAYCQSG